MTVTPADVCRVLQDRAAATYELIDYSFVEGLGVSEETITDVNLVEVRRALPALHVVTKKFTKHEESASSGADWLWVFGQPGRWVSLLVQAKLARPGADTVPKLHHDKGQQRQLLVACARTNNWIPLYVVYNARPAPTPTAGRGATQAAATPGSACAAMEADHRQSGCLAVRPRTVARMFRAHRTTKVAMLLEGGRPWASLFCCPPDGQTIDELADAVLAAMKRFPIDDPHPSSPGARQTDVPDDLWDLSADLITPNLPPIAEAVLRGTERAPSPSIAAVTIVSSAQLDPPRPQPDEDERFQWDR